MDYNLHLFYPFFALQNGLNALHLTSKEGHVAVVEELLARGAKIDAVITVMMIGVKKDINILHHIPSLVLQCWPQSFYLGFSLQSNGIRQKKD